MRIAILVYGRINRCHLYYENIIHTFGKDNQLDFFLSSDNSLDEHLINFINLYKPIEYTNEKIIPNLNYQTHVWRALDASDFDKVTMTNKRESISYNRGDVHNIEKHHINKYRVYKLCEKYASDNIIFYDVVLSLRFDIFFKKKMVFEKIEENTIYIPEGDDYFGINDKFAYGDLHSIKVYSSLVLNAINLIKSGFSDTDPETLLYSHLLHSNIKIQRIQFKISLDPLRYMS
jgi:hypothetical protein